MFTLWQTVNIEGSAILKCVGVWFISWCGICLMVSVVISVVVNVVFVWWSVWDPVGLLFPWAHKKPESWSMVGLDGISCGKPLKH